MIVIIITIIASGSASLNHAHLRLTALDALPTVHALSARDAINPGHLCINVTIYGIIIIL